MTYAVKEIFYSLQGEGAQSGRPAVFCRFAGCNLWSGREADRENAICGFCDTDFVGTDGPDGGKFENSTALCSAIIARWPATSVEAPYVIFTGGEPALQLDTLLVDALHSNDCRVAIETNGTLPSPRGLDWICVSPKAGAPLAQTSGDELKLVYPQAGLEPTDFESLRFRHFFLQPMDGPVVERNTRQALNYCLAHPRWHLSLQTHKTLGIR
jgi:7-carboxy-7-deazaguanine synthase (Cx14CxxC type)